MCDRISNATCGGNWLQGCWLLNLSGEKIIYTYVVTLSHESPMAKIPGESGVPVAMLLRYSSTAAS